MKRFQFLAGFLCGMICFGGGAAYAAGVMADHHPQQVYVDGQAVSMDAYIVAETNYMKLRDIGEAVGFNVYWDGTSVQIESDRPYTGLPPAGWETADAIPGDQVAVALFELILRDNASSAMELFGYASEEEARQDMGLDGNLYEEMADVVMLQFGVQGFTASKEDAQTFVNAFMSMFQNVKMTARLKNLDEKAGAAVVTCTIDTFSPDALETAILQAVQELPDPSTFGGDMDAAFSAMLKAMSKSIAGLKPDGGTADFDVDFVLDTLSVNGKELAVWLPKDAEAFGAAISTTAMGG